MYIAIIADDLTGANDSGLQFASLGLATSVFLGTPSDDLLTDSKVAVIDTETRGLEPEAVAPLVAGVTQRLRAVGTDHIYKKIDSTMRGHVGLEMATVAATMGADHIFLTPAFPAMKRTVVDGVLLVDGVPVSETAIARDPGSPVTDSDLVRLLSPRMEGVRCLSITQAALTDCAPLDAELRAASLAGERLCVIFDAQTDGDLLRVAQAGTALAKANHWTILWAGSAGLAAQLPPVWGFSEPPMPLKTLRRATRPPLLVVGSVNPVSIAQLDTAAQKLKVEPVVLSPDALLGTTEQRQAEVQRGVETLRAQVSAGAQALMLTTAHSARDVDRIVAMVAAKGITRGEAGRLISSGLAEVAQTLLDEGTINRLATTGGDTGRAVMDASEIWAMSVDGAVEPGIPLVTSRNGPRRHIVTKAGGFGSPDALVTAMDYLTEGRLSL